MSGLDRTILEKHQVSRRVALATLSLSPAVLWAADDAVSPFLKGIYAPVAGEIADDKLQVEGKLPDHLHGSYLRNGPNPRFAPKGKYHWFDGDGMVHAVHLAPSDTKVPARYLCRHVRTAGLEEEEKAGKSLFPGLMELPDLARVAKGRDGYKNAANTALVWHHNQLWALWEGGCPHRIDPKSLQTLGIDPLAGAWKGGFTAHPKVDSATGEMIFFGYSPTKPYLRLGILDKGGRLTAARDIDLPRSVMQHDFAITPDYAVFLDMPQTFSLANLALGKGVFGWQPELGARIGLIPRAGGQAKWFAISPGSVFHTLNAWQTAQTVTLIACRMPRFPAEVLAGGATDLPEAERPRLWRYEINLTNSKVTEGPLDDPGSEMPRMREDRISLANRFAYTLRTDFAGWRKHDLVKNTTIALNLPAGWSGAEAVFVATPGAPSEDGGHLLAFVQPPSGDPAQLWVIDAASFSPDPVARVKLPRRIPAGFHGCWVSS
jgi:carotenoid cleavage dioxygenase